MKLLTPEIFTPFADVVAAISLYDAAEPDNFSMASSDAKFEMQNREAFAAELGFKTNRLVMLKQTHSDIIHKISGSFQSREGGVEGDALITSQRDWLLGITVADCVPLLLFDPNTESYAAVHSGWRGSLQNIAGKTIEQMTLEFGVDPADLLAWIGPAAAADNFEVGWDIAGEFNPKYARAAGADRWLFDNKAVVRDQLLDSGVEDGHIEISSLDTITNPELHSARRDGDSSGRMLAVIGLSANPSALKARA